MVIATELALLAWLLASLVAVFALRARIVIYIRARVTQAYITVTPITETTDIAVTFRYFLHKKRKISVKND